MPIQRLNGQLCMSLWLKIHYRHEVGPGGVVFAATLLAAADREGRTAVEILVPFDNVRQKIIQGTEDQPGLGVAAVVKLPNFLGVAPGAVLRGDDNGYIEALMVEQVGVSFLGLMALVAAHIGPEMFGSAPLLVDRVGLLRMAG